jgi:hypothetical protein
VKAAQVESLRAQQAKPSDERRRQATRAARQRALLRENPEMDAVLLARLVNGDVDRQLDRAGRVRDHYATAERDGQIGFGRFGRVKNGG